MSRARKRKYGHTITPTTTSAKWTGVRDPRAVVRFSLDDMPTIADLSDTLHGERRRR